MDEPKKTEKAPAQTEVKDLDVIHKLLRVAVQVQDYPNLLGIKGLVMRALAGHELAAEKELEEIRKKEEEEKAKEAADLKAKLDAEALKAKAEEEAKKKSAEAKQEAPTSFVPPPEPEPSHGRRR